MEKPISSATSFTQSCPVGQAWAQVPTASLLTL